MTRLVVPALLVVLVVGAVYYGRGWLGTAEAESAPSAPVPQGGNRIAEMKGEALPAKALPAPTPAAGGAPAAASPKSAELPAEPTLENTPDERKPLLFAPTYHVAKGLGWNVISDEAAFLAGWYADKRNEERKLIKSLRSRQTRERMHEFNARTETRRGELVARFGLGVASKIVATYPLYRFELPEGRWHRIDADGREVPFAHDDENIFDGSERIR